MSAAVARTFSSLQRPQLPPLLHRPGDLDHRQLDADRRRDVADGEADRLRRRRSGSTAGLQFLPILLFGAWGGLLADRLPKRRAADLHAAVAGGARR